MLHVVQDLLDRPSLTPGYTLPWRSDETQHSPLAFVGRLQARIPRFEQARVTLEAERDRIRHRLEDAEVALAAAAAAARPLPGSREEWAIAASVRQAERESDQARADLGLVEMRLGAEIVWDDVRKGLGRAADVALHKYAAYLRGVYLAEAPATLRHAADRVLQARAVYQRTVHELTALAEGHIPSQPDLIASGLTEALTVLLQHDVWAPPERPVDSNDPSTRGLGGLASRILSRAART